MPNQHTCPGSDAISGAAGCGRSLSRTSVSETQTPHCKVGFLRVVPALTFP